MTNHRSTHVAGARSVHSPCGKSRHATAAVGIRTLPPPISHVTRVDHVGSWPAIRRRSTPLLTPWTSPSTVSGSDAYRFSLVRISQSQSPASAASSAVVKARTAVELKTKSGVVPASDRKRPTRRAALIPLRESGRSRSLLKVAPQSDLACRITSNVFNPSPPGRV